MKNVYFFGDSIAFGQGVTICDTWVCKTAEYLKRMDDSIVVNNLSVNGNTTRMALERMAHDIQGKNIEILIVEFGMNDCNYWQTDCGVPRVSPDSFQANLEEIIKRARVFNTKKIVLLTNHVSGRNDLLVNSDITYQENNQKYNAIIRKVAKEESTLLIDMEDYFISYINEVNEDQRRARIESLLLPDMIHLSRLGHEIYYKFFISQFVERVLNAEEKQI